VGANPVDRGKPGSKLHLVSERHGLPLTAAVTAANVNDTTVFATLLDDVPAVLTLARRRRSGLERSMPTGPTTAGTAGFQPLGRADSCWRR
jgi:hypothetical protein